MTIEKTKEMPETISIIAMDGVFICTALSSKYVMYNLETGDLQDLFAFGPDVRPYITRISKEEFLLNAPNGLGMSVTSAGIAQRPPIQWIYPVNKFIHFDPYIITLSPELISVYSLLDYAQKQVVPFSGGRLIGNYDGRIFLASSSSIYTIQPIPIEKRIEMLLGNEDAQEALNLVENECARRRIDEKFHNLLRNVRIRAGFIFFKNLELDKAKDMFIAGELDPREVISLYPGYLCENSRFVREIPPLHNIADVNQIFKGDKVKVENLKEFLMTYLEGLTDNTLLSNRENEMELNLALLKLFATRKSCTEKLISFVSNKNYVFKNHLTLAIKVLEDKGCYHALACLQKREGLINEALRTWVSIIQKEIQDESFPGVSYFIKELETVPDANFWNYADFALSQDTSGFVEVFKSKSNTNELDDEKIVNFLQKYPKAQLMFLEHLVHEKKVEVESFHSQLALIYLEYIRSESEEKEAQLSKFRRLILQSNFIKPQFLLSRLDKTNLHAEKAILYGKMGEHEKALRIFVSKLKDFNGAEKYCDDMSKSTNLNIEKKKLLTNLLKIYLEDNIKSNEMSSESASIALVNRRSHEMHPVDLLKTLPTSWSIGVLNTALKKSLRSTIHEKRMANINVGLSKGENIQSKFKLYQLVHRPIYIEENAHCVTCKKSFYGSASITRYPNGVMVHSRCVIKENVCPVTGELF
ncbi:transforming growth factor-beta receptor-associated protein 1 isoform X2 [Lepeophtheirus salmonis]|nr:transforming growth factor-beta receptor-associated protein 1-like isoform X2 [Lepeophtheirus salmonis]